MPAEPLLPFWEAATGELFPLLALLLGSVALILAGYAWFQAILRAKNFQGRFSAAIAVPLAIPALLYGPGLRQALMVGAAFDPLSSTTLTTATFSWLRVGLWVALLCGLVSIGLSITSTQRLRQTSAGRLPESPSRQPPSDEATVGLPHPERPAPSSAPSQGNVIRIVFPRGQSPVQFSKQCVIGSDPGCDLVVANGAAPIHAAISRDSDGRLRLAQQANNVVLLNGSPLITQTEYTLSAQDRISIGVSLLVVDVVAGEDEPTLPTERSSPPRAMLLPLDQAGHEMGPIYPLGPDMADVIVGRSREQCDFYLQGKHISRRHAVVRVTAEGYELADLESLEGTRVKGKRITGPHRLHHGEIIELGEWHIRFEHEIVPYENS